MRVLRCVPVELCGALDSLDDTHVLNLECCWLLLSYTCVINSIMSVYGSLYHLVSTSNIAYRVPVVLRIHPRHYFIKLFQIRTSSGSILYFQENQAATFCLAIVALQAAHAERCVHAMYDISACWVFWCVGFPQ